MRVLLINPPRYNELMANNPSIIEEERGYNPPLGVLTLAGYLEHHTDHDVRVLDAQVERMDYGQIQTYAESFRPDVAGITAMTFTLLDVLKTIEAVKAGRQDTKIVVGGPHVHLFPEETINLGNVDFAVMGEGEIAFKELLDYIDSPEALRDVQGLVFKDGDEMVNTGARPLMRDLDALPFAARHLTPVNKYSSLLMKRDPVTTVFTSRGCPFRCTFCDRPNLGKRFRVRSPKNVVDELEACTKMGIYEFLIYDDTFTCQKQRVIDICQEIRRRKLDIGFDVRTRVDTVNEEMIKEMAMAGCGGIHYGVEAGTERILKILKKEITIDRVKHIVKVTQQAGIPVLAYFMIGNPTETREDIFTTFRVINDVSPDYVHMTILSPFPGTALYQDALNRGVIERDVWKEYAQNPTPDFEPPYWGEHFTKEELNDLLVQGYRGFYLRPSYAIKRAMKMRSFSEFKKKAKAGLKVLRMTPA